MTTPYLAVGSANNVLIYRRDTTTALTYVTTFSVGSSRTITGISWSPNGLYLAVSYNVSPYLNIYKYGGSVGSETFTLLSAPATAYLPSVHTAWSSDSSRLINSAYTTAGGYGSPVMQFYNMASDVLTYDRQITGYNRAQGRIKMSADNKYLYGVGVNDSGVAEIFSQSGLDYVRTSFYSSVAAGNSSGVHVSGNLFTIGGSYGTPFRMFDNTSGTPVEFTYPGSGVAPYGGYAPITPDRSYVAVAEDNTDGTVANQLKLFSISGTTLTLATGASSQPTAIASDGYTIATDAEWTSDGVYLALGLYESTTAGAAPFLAWYSRSGGTLTKLTNPSTMPSAIVHAAAWTDPYVAPPPTITLNSTLANSSAAFLQGPVLASSSGYFLQGPVLNNDIALFQQGHTGSVAVTLAPATAAFMEGDDGKLVVTLAPAIAAFIEGNDGLMRATLSPAISGFSLHQPTTTDDTIFDIFKTSDVPSSQINSSSSIVELAQFLSSLQLAFNNNVAELMALTATVDGTRQVIVLVAEQMVASGLASSQLHALNLIAELVHTYDAADRAFLSQINELMNLRGLSDSQVSVLVQAVDSLVIQEALSASALVIKAVSESIQVTDGLSISGVLGELIAEGIAFRIAFGSDFGIFDTWVVNTETGAPSRYQAFNFNSYANKRGLSLGASDAGLYQLDNDDDDGQEISGSFTTGKLRFGSSQMKNVPSVYLAFNASGKLALKVVSEQNGKPTERWYRMEGAAGSAREGRFKLGRGDKSPYWQFTLVNVTGSDFEIDQMDYDVIRLSRRI